MEPKDKTKMRTVAHGLEELKKLPWIIKGETIEEEEPVEDGDF
jgi:hypothetical protein